ncbi:MAG: hypothetical protein MJZ03_05590 [archaeon]|nr:hypothetical protein [archaeon]
MGCSSRRKSCNDKSCQRYYNTQTQAIAANTPLQVQIAGAKVVDSGIAIETEPASYTITKKGLYHIAADITVNAATVGTATFSAYLDGVQLPCTKRTVTLVVGTTEIHTETELDFSHCFPCINKTITFVIEGSTVAGTVTQLCSGVLKLA